MVNTNHQQKSFMKYALKSWLEQRITALVMLLFAIIFIICVFIAEINVNSNINSWQMFFSNTFIKIAMQIFFIAVIWHGAIVVRDIIMDYITCNIIKLTLYTILILYIIANIIYSIKVLF